MENSVDGSFVCIALLCVSVPVLIVIWVVLLKKQAAARRERKMNRMVADKFTFEERVEDERRRREQNDG
jgi:cytochrome c oxidase assembly factor CtaG